MPWTFDEVLGIVADRGDDFAVVGQTVKAWSDQPRWIDEVSAYSGS
jgi:hypothetical protein